MTEIVFILDRSGSMAELAADTVGGFNAMLKEQKEKPDRALISTVLFNSQTTVLHDRIPIDEAPLMQPEDFKPRGSTALLDAVGGAIRHIGCIHKYARREDVPEKTLFVITTDGMENASHLYTYETVREMIGRQQEKYGWEFIFLGANIDAAREAGNFGIEADRAADYHADEQGTALNYQVISRTVSMLRTHKTVAPAWKQSIDADYKKRK